jgi:hypothetical protein
VCFLSSGSGVTTGKSVRDRIGLESLGDGSDLADRRGIGEIEPPEAAEGLSCITANSSDGQRDAAACRAKTAQQEQRPLCRCGPPSYTRTHH